MPSFPPEGVPGAACSQPPTGLRATGVAPSCRRRVPITTRAAATRAISRMRHRRPIMPHRTPNASPLNACAADANTVSTVRLCTGNATDLSTHRRRHRRVLDARQSNSDLCRRALSMSYDCYCVTLERRLQLPLTAVGDSLSEQLFDTFRCHLCPEALSICTGPCLGVEALACVALNRSEGCEGSAPNRPRFKRRRGWDLRST